MEKVSTFNICFVCSIQLQINLVAIWQQYYLKINLKIANKIGSTLKLIKFNLITTKEFNLVS